MATPSLPRVPARPGPNPNPTAHDRARLLTRPDAAELLDVRPATLGKWAAEGSGPAFVRVGRSVRYRLGDLLDYLDRRTVAPTAPHRADKGGR